MTEHATTRPSPDGPNQRSGRDGAAPKVVVAVDGPSGSGKSSTSRGVAQRLGLRYLDTGAMYRAMTQWMLADSVDVTDPDAVAARASEAVLQVGTDPGAPTVSIDGVDVTTAIRSPEVTSAVSLVSAVPAVRARMVAAQRSIIGAGGIVVEGRDIGTTVAPDADVKVYLVASATARAVRRHAELGPAAGEVTETGAALQQRDAMDSTRAASPLAKAEDAVIVDSTDHSLAEVIDLIVAMVPATGRP